jgi:hypothetical protein
MAHKLRSSKNVVTSWMILASMPLCIFVWFVLVFWPLCLLWFESSCVNICHLYFFWLLVTRCVCARSRVGRGLFAMLVFPMFFVCCDLCSGCVIYCHLWLTGFKGLCVCTPKYVALWFVIDLCVICLWTCAFWSI